MPAPGEVRRWVSIDQHRFSIVAATLPPDGGKPEVCRIETTERAIRRFIEKLGGPEGLSVCYEAGPGGFALWRLLTKIGVACDVVAPSLIPVRAGDRVKTDRGCDARSHALSEHVDWRFDDYRRRSSGLVLSGLASA